MKKKSLAALLLAGVTATHVSAPARALSGAGAAAILTAGASNAAAQTALLKRGISLTPPAQDGASLSFDAIERTVRAHNPTIQSLDKMTTSIASTDISEAFFNQSQGYDQQIQALKAQQKAYLASAENLEAAGQGDLAKAMRTLAAQAGASIAMNNAILSGLEDAEDDAEDDLDDSLFAFKKQAENASRQIVQGAQTLYITLCTLQDNVAALDRGLAAIDRSIPVVQKQYDIGMASQLDLLNLKNKRAGLESTKKTLIQQVQNLENSLSLLMGNDAGKTVHAQSLPEVQIRALSAMNYTDDLAEALQNSYAVWQKEDAVRQASNDYEDNVTSTLDAYKAAQIARDAAKEEAKTSFRKLFEDVSEKQRLVSAAEADLALAETNFRVAAMKHEEGMTSALEYASAQDDLETARQAVQTAKINLFSAFNTYEWAKRGLM